MNNFFTYNGNSETFSDSLPDKIAKYLLHNIFSGKYKQGDRIIEADIAKELQVSHAPVREALYLLQKDGVVERLPRKGVRVKSFTEKELIDYSIALVDLIEKALGICEKKWTDIHQNRLQVYFDELTEQKEQGRIFEYVQKLSQFLHYFFVVADNTAYTRFFLQATFTTNVVAQELWNIDKERVNRYNALMEKTVESIGNNDFNTAKKLMREAFYMSLT